MNKKRKDDIRKFIAKTFWVTYWTSFFYSKFLAILAMRYRFLYLGRVHIASSVKVTGWSSCSFGRNVVIGARSWINVNYRNSNAKSIMIGENTFIGCDNFLTSGEVIEIGPYCLTGSHCSFIGSSHNVDDPFKVYSTTGTSNDIKIIIGANTFFGYGAMVQGNVKIGHGCVVGAGAVVLKDVPPFSVVVGNPARVVKYYDFEQEQWLSGCRPESEYASIPDEITYIKKLSSNQRYIIQPLSAATQVLGDI